MITIFAEQLARNNPKVDARPHRLLDEINVICFSDDFAGIYLSLAAAGYEITGAKVVRVWNAAPFTTWPTGHAVIRIFGDGTTEATSPLDRLLPLIQQAPDYSISPDSSFYSGSIRAGLKVQFYVSC